MALTMCHTHYTPTQPKTPGLTFDTLSNKNVFLPHEKTRKYTKHININVTSVTTIFLLLLEVKYHFITVNH